MSAYSNDVIKKESNTSFLVALGGLRSRKPLMSQFLCGTALFCLSLAGTAQSAKADCLDAGTCNLTTDSTGKVYEIVGSGDLTMDQPRAAAVGLDNTTNALRQVGSVNTTIITSVGGHTDMQANVDTASKAGYTQLVQPNPNLPNATPGGSVVAENGTVTIDGPNQDKTHQGSIATNGIIVVGRGDTSFGTTSNVTANITNGGTVSVQPFKDKDGNVYSTLNVGYGRGATGTVNVTGKGSLISNENSIEGGVTTVGDDGGTGTLNVGDANGGTLKTGILDIGGVAPADGYDKDGYHFPGYGPATGTVNVNGNGTIFIGSNQNSGKPALDQGISVGGEGTGYLNIGDGTGNATVTVNGEVILGNENVPSGLGVDSNKLLENVLSGNGGDGAGYGMLTLNKGGTLAAGDVTQTITMTDSSGNSVEKTVTADGILTTKSPYKVVLNGGTLQNRDIGGTLTNKADMVLGTGSSSSTTAAVKLAVTSASSDTNSTINTNQGTVNLSGKLSGSGGVNFTGGGTTNISGQNTYTGTTTIDSGTTVAYQDSGTTTSSTNSDGTITNSSSIVDNGTIVVNHSDNVTIPSDISGTGGLNQNGSGRTTLTGTDTYSGDTNVNNGQLMVGEGGSLTQSNVHINSSSASFGVSQSGNTTLSQKIDGSGQFLKEGTGTTTLSGIDTYTGDTTINGGTLALGDGSSNGTNNNSVSSSGAFHVASGATLETNHSDNVTLSSNIDGAGSFIQNGSGIVRVTGQNTFTGDTIVNNGRIFYGDGTAAGTNSDGTVTESKNITLNNNGIVNIEHSDNIAMNSTITGSGSFVQNGSGTTTLNGSVYLDSPSALNTAFPTNDKQVIPGGTVLVDKGTLDVDGSAGGVKDSSGQYIASSAGGRVNISTNGYVIVGRETGAEATLSLHDGAGLDARAATSTTQQLSSSIQAGFSSGSKGTITVDGAETSLTADGAQGQIVLGNRGEGTLNVQSEGSVGANQIILGLNDGSKGTLNVIGNNSLVIAGGYDAAPNTSSGVLVNGAGDGTVTVAQGGTLNVNGQLRFGNSSNTNGKGTLNLYNGGTLAISNVAYTDSKGVSHEADGIVTSAQPYQINLAGGTLQVLPGGALSTSANMSLGQGTSNLDLDKNGTITLSGGLSGNGGLNIDDSKVKSSSGSSSGQVTLSGVDTYTGDTTITRGTLILGDGSANGTNSNDNSISESSAFHIGKTSSLVVDHSDNVTLSSNIDGSGDFTQSGSGRTTLTGTDSASGVTHVNAGQLMIGDGGSIEQSDIDLRGEGNSFGVNQSGDTTLSQKIYGNGDFLKEGTGTTTLTGLDTYTGDTTISGGTLVIGNGTNSGTDTSNNTISQSKAFHIASSGILSVNHSDNVTLSSNIDGAGTFNQNGSGRLTLKGSDTATGDINVNNGQLMVGDGGSITQSNIHINGDNTFGVSQSTDASLSQKIDGSGQFLKEGKGTTTLSGIDTYTGDTIINGGTLIIGDGSSNGTISGGHNAPNKITDSENFHVASGATLETNHSDNVTLSSNIDGAGSFVQNGNGIVRVTGQNTFTGDTIVNNNGRLFYGDGTAAGTNEADNTVTESKNITLNNNGIINIEHSDNIAMNSTITGSGSFVQNGSGTTTLNGSVYLDNSTVLNTPFPTNDKQIIPGATVLVDKGTLVADGAVGGVKDSSGQYIESAAGGRVNISTNGYVIVGRETGAEGNLVLKDGAGLDARAATSTTQQLSSSIQAGFSSGSKGTITVDGTETSLTADGAQGQIVLGNRGEGTLNVQNGGSVQANQILVGYGQGSNGALNVTGDDSLVIIGNSANTNTNSGLSVSGVGNGKVVVSNGGQLVVNGQITFGNDIVGTDGKGTLNLEKGGTLTVANVSFTNSQGTVESADGIVASSAPYQINLDGGTLQVNQSGRLTTAVNMALGTGTTTNLDLDGNGKITLGGTLSGSGGLKVDDSQVQIKSALSSGQVTLNGVDTYTGDTTITRGTLSLGDGSANGTNSSDASISKSGRFHIAGQGVLALNHSDNVVLASNIDGSGVLNQNGSGRVTLTGTDSATGDTNVNAGQLMIGDGGSITQSTIHINGTKSIFGVNQSGTLTLSQNIDGTGNFLKEGVGKTILNGVDTYTGDTTIKSGTLAMGDGSAQGTNPEDHTITEDAIHIAKGAVLETNHSDNVILPSDIDGAGTFNQEGSGRVTLTGTDSATGDTNVNNGQLMIGDGGSITQSTIHINGTKSIFGVNQKGKITLSNKIDGTGQFLKEGKGTTILAGEDIYTGDTTVKGGTLALGDGSTNGTINNGDNAAKTVTNSSNFHVSDNAALEVNHSDDVTLSSVIDGDGSFVQDGSGVLIMTGTNSYTGGTDVNNGTLQIDGDESEATGLTTVSSNATLRGTGTIGGNVAVNGGTITASDAGSSQMGTLTINGNLALNNDTNGNGAKLEVRLGSNNAADLIKVGGSAKIQDGTKLVANTQFGTNFGSGYDYRIITANKGITVSLAALNKNMVTTNRYLQASLNSDASGSDTLDLVLEHTSKESFAAGKGMTRNANAVGYALDSSSGEIAQDAPYMDSSVSDGSMTAVAKAERQKSYNALSGEINASIRSALFQNGYYIRQAVFDRLHEKECNGSQSKDMRTPENPHAHRLTSMRCTQQETLVWGQSYGGMGSNGGNSNSATLHHNTAGFIVGADHQVGSGPWRIGATLGYDHTGFNVHDGRSSSGSSNDITIGAYAGRKWGDLELALGADYTWNVIDTSRRVNYNVYNGSQEIGRSFHQHGSSLSGLAQVYGQVGYNFHFAHNTLLEPFAGLTYMNLNSGSSTETGGAAALHVYKQDVGITLMSIGVRASSKFKLGHTVLEPYGSAAYRHGFGALTPSAHESFARGGSGVMDISGAPMSDDTALLDIGLRAWLSDRIDVGVSYVGQYGNHSTETGVRANVRVRF